jgi:hypothetical protein
VAEHFGRALSTGGSDPLVDGQRLSQVGRAFGGVAVPEVAIADEQHCGYRIVRLFSSGQQGHELGAGQPGARAIRRRRPGTGRAAALTTFVITKAQSPAKLPKPQPTVSSIEFAFRGRALLHDGDLVRFANHGFLVHMIVAARARSAAGAREMAGC